MMTGEFPGRNDPSGLAHRAIKNLRAIRNLSRIGADVHVVTQAVLSSYAVIVVARERKLLKDNLVKSRLSTKAKAWIDMFSHEVGKPESAVQLLENLRHSIAHANISFSSESRDPEEVEIRFENRNPKTGFSIVWVARISAARYAELAEEILDVLFLD